MLGFAGMPRPECSVTILLLLSLAAACQPWAAGAEQGGKVLCLSSPALQPQKE